MGRVLFVSDVHLGAQRPAVAEAFLDLLGRLRADDTLYLLGDVFDAWLGDDAVDALGAHTAEVLAGCVERGATVCFMAGNHDFLLGPGFAERCRMRLLDDPAVALVHGERVLLGHGDLWCTDDVEYQAFRAWARQPDNQRAFLSMPLAERLQQAEDLRARSRASTQRKPAAVMDVNDQAIADALREHGVGRMIHGHTHRPATHSLLVAGRPCSRHVLGDWYAIDRARVLFWQGGAAPTLLPPSALDA